MTRRTALPIVDDVYLAITELTEATGKPPTVLAVAGRLGLANTTFRRHFPDITADLTQKRSATTTSSTEAGIARFDKLKHDNDKLRRDNHDLAENLDLAVANIQRLTLENHRLRRELEAAAKVARLGRRPT